MAQSILIPRSMFARFGGTVSVGANGVFTKIPVGVPYVATDAEVDALNAAGIPIAASAGITVPTGSVFIPRSRYGNQLAISLNGRVTYLPTGVVIVPTSDQITALQSSGIEYLGAVTGTPNPGLAPSFSNLPMIAGTPMVGVPLSSLTYIDATPQNGTVITDRAYLLDGVARPLVYTPVAADVGATLEFHNIGTGTNGATLEVSSTPPVAVVAAASGTLNALTVSPNTGPIGSPYSGTVTGLTAGSTRSLSGAGAAGLSITGNVISGTPTTAGPVNVVETLASTTNSPRTTTTIANISQVIVNNLRSGQTSEFGGYFYNTGETGGHQAATEAFIGAPADFRLGFLDGPAYSDTVYKMTPGPAGRVVWAIPLAWDNQSLTVTVGGTIDNQFVAMANFMLARETTPKIDVRLGWEMNGGTGYAWGKGNNGSTPALYVQAYNRVAALMRALPGGDRFRFIWNPNNIQGDAAAYYPDNTLVDMIAVDVYDNKTYASGTSQTAIQSDYNFLANDTAQGAKYYANLAVSKGKLFGVPEWGFNSNDHGSVFAQFIAFLYANNSVLNGFWDSNSAFNGQVSNGQYPALSQPLINGFGQPGYTSPTTLMAGDGKALSATLVPNHPLVSATIKAGGNASLFTLTGNTLSMTAQTYNSGGGNDRTVTITTTDNRGLTKDTLFTITVVAAGTITTAFTDTYTGTDGTALSAYNNWTNDTGSMSLLNNQVICTSIPGKYRQTFQPQGPDFDWEHDFITTASPLAAQNMWITFRDQDGVNYGQAGFLANTGWSLGRTTVADATYVGTTLQALTALAANTTYRVKVSARGNVMTMYLSINGAAYTTLGSVTYTGSVATTLAGKGKVGIRVSGVASTSTTGARHDNAKLSDVA